MLTRDEIKFEQKCSSNPRSATWGPWICNRNLMIEIPAHTCVTRHDYDFETDLKAYYDLLPGEYTLRPKKNWRDPIDFCKPQSKEPFHAQPGDLTFKVTTPTNP